MGKRTLTLGYAISP
ncbi:hypothetical protein ACLK19_04185 [Escherichia coli]